MTTFGFIDSNRRAYATHDPDFRTKLSTAIQREIERKIRAVE
jgi:hypothetical protein